MPCSRLSRIRVPQPRPAREIGFRVEIARDRWAFGGDPSGPDGLPQPACSHGRMDSARWLRHFETNRLNRPEPDWHLPSTEDPRTAAKLARSLSHFQLGESGEGTFLLAEACRAYPDDPQYVEALQLFIREEQEHARLLGHLVARFKGEPTSRHWTHGCFSLLRRALGMQFELQILLIAEVIGTAYYRLLRAGARDPVLRQVCDLMLRDEAPHLVFHRQGFTERQAHWLPIERRLWAAQFQVFFLAAIHAAWLDHGSALTAVGAKRRDFLRQARRECVTFLSSRGWAVLKAAA
jgi:hypothetical protein